MTRFQDEGGVVTDDTYYIEREADHVLLERLREGRLCVVLAPRQIGKSSLRDRTQRRLEEGGIATVHIDLTDYRQKGATVTEHEVYGSIIGEIVHQLGWKESRVMTEMAELSPQRWWTEFLRHELPERLGKPTVIFLDEIDSIRDLKSFEPDSFFSSIRLTMNKPPVTFCLLGTMTPWEFSRDPKAPPFNVGVVVRLEDFTREEAPVLLPGLRPLGDPERRLDEVLAWTSGHPYLTQRVCAALVAAGGGSVDDIVEQAFAWDQEDKLFPHTERAFDGYAGGPAGIELVELYGRLLDGEQIAPDASSRAQLELRVTGMVAVRVVDGRRVLAVRNKIYARHFDRAWLKRRRMHRFLAAAVTHWRESEHRRGFLGEADLEDVVQWAASQESISGEEASFLIASQRAVERSHQRRFQLWRGGLVASFVLLLVAGFGLWSSRQSAAESGEALDRQRKLTSSLVQNIDSLKKQQEIQLKNAEDQRKLAEDLAASRGDAIITIQANLEGFKSTLKELERLNAVSQENKRRITDLRGQLEQAEQRARKENEANRTRVAELEADAKKAKSEADNARLQADASAAAVKKAEQERASLAQQLQQVKDALTLAEKRADATEAARLGTENVLKATQGQLTSIEKQLADAQQKVNDTQKDLDDAKAKVDATCKRFAPPNTPCP